MKTVAIETSDLKLSELSGMTRSGMLIVTKKGEPVYSITRLSADDRERLALARNPKFRAIIEDSRRSLRTEGGLTMEEVCQEFGLKDPARKTRQSTKEQVLAELGRNDKKTKSKLRSSSGVRSRTRRTTAVATK
jgi:hypothetical protein